MRVLARICFRAYQRSVQRVAKTEDLWDIVDPWIGERNCNA